MRHEWFDLSEQDRIMAVASSVNYENKAITLLHCLDDELKTKTDMRHEFEDVAHKYGLRVPAHNSFSTSAQQLEEYGFARRDQIDRGRWTGIDAWSITYPGEEIGREAAQIAMDVSLENDIPLMDILGRSNSSGDTTSPYNSTVIMSYVNDNPNHYMREICRGTEVSPQVVFHKHQS